MRLSLLFAAALLSACASAADPDAPSELEQTLADARLGEQVDRICFPRAIDGFRDNRDRTVVVRRGVSDDYLLVLRSCPQLDRAQGIALINSATCLRPFDAVIVSESVFGFRGPGQIGDPTCYVDAIYRWDEDAPDAEAGDTQTPAG